jgi:hypothetical protein
VALARPHLVDSAGCELVQFHEEVGPPGRRVRVRERRGRQEAPGVESVLAQLGAEQFVVWAPPKGRRVAGSHVLHRQAGGEVDSFAQEGAEVVDREEGLPAGRPI